VCRYNPAAQCQVGRMYEQGIGCHVDVEEAMKWYQSAARRHYPEAQNNLGVLLYLVGLYKWNPVDP
jgi:TPR repeat protein